MNKFRFSPTLYGWHTLKQIIGNCDSRDLAIKTGTSLFDYMVFSS